MAIPPVWHSVLKAVSRSRLSVRDDLEALRRLKRLRPPAFSIGRSWEHFVAHGDYAVPVRIFAPDAGPLGKPVIVYFHGGGWSTGTVDAYHAICQTLARTTDQLVVSVDYRLAPEYPFPIGLEDCYAVAKEIFTQPQLLLAKPERITLMGDSAGGNLAAAVSLLAKERGEFTPRQQILLYPATYSDHSPQSPFFSVHENGSDYLLTSRSVEEYMQLYVSDPKELQNPLVAPLLAEDLSHQPRTLVLVAEYDPLRDEGIAYANRLAEAGNSARWCVIPDALHGFFSLPSAFAQVEAAYEEIHRFFGEEEADATGSKTLEKP